MIEQTPLLVVALSTMMHTVMPQIYTKTVSSAPDDIHTEAALVQ